MKNLLTITDLEATGENLVFPKVHEHRQAARAVVTDDAGKVALLYISRGKFHKLPGGGVEKGENLAVALERELLEEIGCRAVVNNEIGIIEEKCAKLSLHQTSYCFRAKIVGEKEESNFTEREIFDGASVIWVDSISAAITLLENDKPIEFQGHFIVMRDLAFLKAAQEL